MERDAEGDAATRDASAADAAVDAMLASWRDVPQGPAPAPREVCTRSWDVPLITNTFVLANMATAIVSDDDGNLYIAGNLTADQDFGAGVLKVPVTPSGELPRSATFLLKLDAACALVWSKTIMPAQIMTARSPWALGFDDAHNLTLVTDSTHVVEVGTNRVSNEASLEFAVLDRDGKLLSERSQPISKRTPLFYNDLQATRHGSVLISAWIEGPLELGGVPVWKGDGQDFNAFYAADGTFRRTEVFGTSERNGGIRQWLGAQDQLLAYGSHLDAYYGQSLVGETLVALDRDGQLRWKQELHPYSPLGFIEFAAALAEDGAIGFYDGYGAMQEGPRTFAIRELTPAGATVWELPLTQSRPYALSLRELVWMQGALAGHGYSFASIALGNSQLTYEPVAQIPRAFVFALEPGGVTRWAGFLPENQGIRASATTPAEELAVIAHSNTDSAAPRMYLHKYAR